MVKQPERQIAKNVCVGGAGKKQTRILSLCILWRLPLMWLHVINGFEGMNLFLLYYVTKLCETFLYGEEGLFSVLALRPRDLGVA